MNSLIKTLHQDYIVDDYKVRDDLIVLKIRSFRNTLNCPYCDTPSEKVHSYYEREIQDLPIQNRRTILLVKSRKMFCSNTECSHKTFSERHPFADRKGKRTTRLEKNIIYTSSQLSSVNASKVLSTSSIKIGKSSICTLLKKNAPNCG